MEEFYVYETYAYERVLCIRNVYANSLRLKSFIFRRLLYTRVVNFWKGLIFLNEFYMTELYNSAVGAVVGAKESYERALCVWKSIMYIKYIRMNQFSLYEIYTQTLGALAVEREVYIMYENVLYLCLNGIIYVWTSLIFINHICKLHALLRLKRGVYAWKSLMHMKEFYAYEIYTQISHAPAAEREVYMYL